jgi:hypothetical protein
MDDLVYAGPSVVDDRIRVASALDDSIFAKVGYSARRGDGLSLVGTLGFVHDGIEWVLDPRITEFAATKRDAPGRR